MNELRYLLVKENVEVEDIPARYRASLPFVKKSTLDVQFLVSDITICPVKSIYPMILIVATIFLHLI